MSEIRIPINQIVPADSPSKSSWERSKGVRTSFKATLYMVANYYMPADGNHRLARLYERYGGDFIVDASVYVMEDPIDVVGFTQQIHDVQDLGIRSFADFVRMCNDGNFDRD